MTVHAHAAHSAGGALTPFEYNEADLGPHDIDVTISHCGVCHSDVHLVDNDWQFSRYPLVPGHEIIGIVAETGAQSNLRVGQRVGIGWQRGACLTCDLCKAGHENLCPSQRATCIGAHGGFADRIRVDGRFAFPIPDALESEDAAPLLCGGVTVFAPLMRFGAGPNVRVGVVGIGGLGHLAVQFAAKMGSEVTAFSSSADKEDEAMGLGATHFVSSTRRSAVNRLSRSLDLIINTVHVELDWASYLSTLRPNGTLCFVGVPGLKLDVPFAAFVFSQRRLTGSVTGGRREIGQMLSFAAQHGVGATTEPMAMDEADHALARVRSGKARYRVVLTR